MVALPKYLERVFLELKKLAGDGPFKAGGDGLVVVAAKNLGLKYSSMMARIRDLIYHGRLQKVDKGLYRILDTQPFHEAKQEARSVGSEQLGREVILKHLEQLIQTAKDSVEQERVALKAREEWLSCLEHLRDSCCDDAIKPSTTKIVSNEPKKFGWRIRRFFREMSDGDWMASWWE